MVIDMPLEVRQAFLTVGARPLAFMHKDRQGAKEGKVARAAGFVHLAAIFILRAIPAMVLPVFDAPVAAIELEAALGRGLLRREGREAVSDFFFGFDDVALAHGVADALQAEELFGPGQTERLGIGGHGPDRTLLEAPMRLIDRLGLRGEKRL